MNQEDLVNNMPNKILKILLIKQSDRTIEECKSIYDYLQSIHGQEYKYYLRITNALIQ
jgi:hypothetical protein